MPGYTVEIGRGYGHRANYSDARLQATIEQLQARNSELEQELAAARKRIAKLEARR